MDRHLPVRRFPRLIAAALLLLGAVAAASGLPAAAAGEKEGSPLTVPEASVCTEVKDRQAVGAASEFPAGVGRLFCWTRVNGAVDPTTVKHVWFHDEKKVHEVDLSIGGPSWRTWSSKTIPAGWTGAWRVDVQDGNGVVIYSIPFTIKEDAH